MKTNLSRLEFGLIVFIGIGVLLAFKNFLFVRSLWYDEAMLALNIVNRSALELLTPLDMCQAAPIGFLLLEKISTTIFGNHDWALRILPFIFYLLAIPIFYLTTFKIFQDKIFSLFSSALFSMSPSMIYFSSEVKQYMSDVLIGLIIILYTYIFLSTKDPKQKYVYAGIGAAAICFSNVSIIILCAMCTYAIYKISETKRNLSDLAIPILTWTITFLIYYINFIHGHPSKDYMQEYWSAAFLPRDILSKGFLISLATKLKGLIDVMGFKGYFNIIVFPVLIGIFFLARKNIEFLFITILTISISLGLSYFKLYPFFFRLILYLSPFIIILFALGIYHPLEYLIAKIKWLPNFILFLPLLILGLALSLNLPIQKQEIKHSLDYLNNKISSKDNLLIYRDGHPAFSFYKKNYKNFEKVNTIVTPMLYESNWEEHENQIRQLSGINWIVFSHQPLPSKKQKDLEKRFILRSFAQSGYQIINEKHFVGSSIYKVKPSPNIKQ